LLGHGKLEITSHYTRVATGIIAAVASPIGRLFGTLAEPETGQPKAATPKTGRRRARHNRDWLS
jgi:hypothetical protein